MVSLTVDLGNKGLSLLCPKGVDPEYKVISDEAFHDLALDELCKRMSKDEKEQRLFSAVLSHLTTKPEVIQYRLDVFEEIKNHKKMREELLTLFDKIDFMKNFGSFRKESDAKGIWDFIHRLDEMRDYIACVEAIQQVLGEEKVQSEGLRAIQEYVGSLYVDRGYRELKQDVDQMTFDTSNLKSVTLGVNLNDRFEARSIGLISINAKPFTKSNVISNFCDFLSRGDSIEKEAAWNGSYRYHPANEDTTKGLGKELEKAAAVIASSSSPVFSAGVASVEKDESTNDIMHYLDQTADHMLNVTTKKLKETLSKYATISILEIAALIPELIYYVRVAEYMEDLQQQGYSLNKPQLMSKTSEMPYEKAIETDAKGIYNFKLAFLKEALATQVVKNDLQFDADNLIYILTGANRGGKTTITQAVGQAYVLAQGGLYVPADAFLFEPIDQVYTHFPADEDKTLDLGRLGEECQRFKAIYEQSTEKSLILLNETFSTTSFEEGFFIAFDSVRALRIKGARTIYNTHMHKLGVDIPQLNEGEGKGKAQSLIMETREGERSYKLKRSAPEMSSYANDIAKKYGVTYEQLTK